MAVIRDSRVDTIGSTQTPCHRGERESRQHGFDSPTGFVWWWATISTSRCRVLHSGPSQLLWPKSTGGEAETVLYRACPVLVLRSG